jgi:hypothetical protein
MARDSLRFTILPAYQLAFIVVLENVVVLKTQDYFNQINVSIWLSNGLGGVDLANDGVDIAQAIRFMCMIPEMADRKAF